MRQQKADDTPGVSPRAAARSVRAAALGIVILLAALAAGACGPGERAFVSERYGFSLLYDPDFLVARDAVPQASSGRAPLMTVAFLDPAAAKAASRRVDGVVVSVHNIPDDVDWSGPTPPLRTVKAAVTAGLHELDATASRVRKVACTTGRGYEISYTYNLAGTHVRAVTYFLYASKRQYQITLQAHAATWKEMEPRLALSLASFALL